MQLGNGSCGDCRDGVKCETHVLSAACVPLGAYARRAGIIQSSGSRLSEASDSAKPSPVRTGESRGSPGGCEGSRRGNDTESNDSTKSTRHTKSTNPVGSSGEPASVRPEGNVSCCAAASSPERDSDVQVSPGSRRFLIQARTKRFKADAASRREKPGYSHAVRRCADLKSTVDLHNKGPAGCGIKTLLSF